MLIPETIPMNSVAALKKNGLMLTAFYFVRIDNIEILKRFILSI